MEVVAIIVVIAGLAAILSKPGRRHRLAGMLAVAGGAAGLAWGARPVPPPEPDLPFSCAIAASLLRIAAENAAEAVHSAPAREPRADPDAFLTGVLAMATPISALCTPTPEACLAQFRDFEITRPLPLDDPGWGEDRIIQWKRLRPTEEAFAKGRRCDP